MTITVIGHLCLDVIHQRDGKETQSYGGILFSVAALANLLKSEDTVFPVFGVGKAEYDAFMERVSSYSNIDSSGIFRFGAPTNQVRLSYGEGVVRGECSRHIAEPIAWKRIRPYLESDMLLINMVSGFDLTLDTLDQIRMEVRENRTPIYMDVHSLTLGIREDFSRYHRPLEDWRRWLFMIHGAQMNQEEAAILTDQKFDEQTLAKQVTALNTEVLMITRGERGCTAFVADHKQVRRTDIPGNEGGETVDSTGCGDVFAAAYCARYLSSRSVLESARFANRVAAFNARFAGSLDIDKLAEFRLQDSAPEEQRP